MALAHNQVAQVVFEARKICMQFQIGAIDDNFDNSHFMGQIIFNRPTKSQEGHIHQGELQKWYHCGGGMEVPSALGGFSKSNKCHSKRDLERK